MSQGSDINESVTVSNDGVTVEKTVTAEEFPVPAVVFTLRSSATEPVHVRLTDQIPESFPMERVGFHPEFESDQWTAYKDHRVEFERDLESGEEVKTVYGIRTEDTSELSAFLSEPEIKEVAASERAEAADIEGVLGPDNSQLIRDVLSGERSSLPGVDDDEPLADPLEASESDPLNQPATSAGTVKHDDPLAASTDTDTEPSFTDEFPSDTDDTDDTDEDDDWETVSGDGPEDEKLAVDADRADGSADSPEETDGAEATDSGREATETVAPPTPNEIDAELTAAVTDAPVAETQSAATPDSGSPADAEGGIAAALAAELRNDTVSKADRKLLGKALGAGIPRSVEVRLSRLQSQVEDLTAYSDALAAFIDENGTATEVLGALRADVDSLSTDLDDLAGDIEATETDQTELTADVTALRTDVDAVDRELETLDDTVSTTADDVGSLQESVTDHDETLTTVSGDIEALDERVSANETAVDAAVETAETAQSAADAASDSVERIDTDIDSAFADLGELGETVDSLDEAVDDVRTDLSALHSDLDDVEASLRDEIASLQETLDELADLSDKADASDVAAVETRVASLEEGIETLETFRERLNSAFGGMGPAGAGDDA